MFYSKPCVTLTYSERLHLQPWYILKSRHIQNPTKYLRWSILLRTLCNCGKFRRPIYSKLWLIQSLEYLKVWRYLGPCQIDCSVFWNLTIFKERFFLDYIRCLAGFSIRPCIYKYHWACTAILGPASGIFRLFEHYSRAYMHIQNLVYPWYI